MKLLNELTQDEIISEVQNNFVIEVNGMNFVGKREQKAHNFKTLVSYLKRWEYKKGKSEELAMNMFKSAMNSDKQVFYRKLRRGITIKFYSK